MVDIHNIVRPIIKKMRPYTSARDDYSGSTEIFLDANENPYGRYNRYPDPQQTALKRLISGIKQVAVEHIFLGNGSDEVIDLLFRIFCQPGVDKALVFTPAYGLYAVYAQMNEVALLTVPLNADFQIESAKVIPYFNDKHLKLMFICSPNNPTGNTICAKEMGYLLAHFKGILVVDEAYIDFSEHASWSTYLKKYANLVVIQTLSKAWGAAGIRLGIAYANKPIIGYLNKVKPPYNIGTLNQQKASEQLQNKAAFDKHLAAILQARAQLKRQLAKLAIVQHVYPSDANFLLIIVQDADAVYKALIRQQIIVRNRSSLLKNALRITIGTRTENAQLIKALKQLSV